MVMSGSGVMEFVPDPSKPGLLIGSDFTAFFTATVQINNKPSLCIAVFELDWPCIQSHADWYWLCCILHSHGV